MDENNEPPAFKINWVLLGKTGSGKSAVGNTLLGRPAFLSKKSPKSVTQEVQVEHGTVQGLPVTVYDTPGFFDTELNDEKIREKCQSVFNKCESDLSVFLLVIKADRFTEEERRTVEKIEKVLGQNRLEKTWILFTRGDELEENDQTIREFISETPELKKLVEKFQNRYHVFNNKLKDSFKQVRTLLLQVIKKCFKKTAKHLGRRTQRPKVTASNRCSSSDRRIVLLGKSGVGKSATGNTILGETHFKSKLKMNSVTKKSECSHAADRKVYVVDTPGLCDTNLKVEQVVVEIARSIYLCSPGPHAFLIVLPVNGRFTSQEQEVIEQIETIFGDEVAKYAIILFTHGDHLEKENVHELIQENEHLRELVQLCGNRYHVFNNKDKKNKQQVTDLLEKIDRMVENNGGSCYSNQMFKDAAKCRMEEEERVRREEEERKQTEEQQRQEKVERVKKETEDRIRAEMERKKNEEVERIRAEMERNKKEEVERIREEIVTEMKVPGNSTRQRAAPKLQLQTTQIEEQIIENIENETDKGFRQFMSKYWKYILGGACIGGIISLVIACPLAAPILTGVAAVAAGFFFAGGVGVAGSYLHYESQTKKKS